MSKKNQMKQGKNKKNSLLIIFILIAGLAATGMAGYFWYKMEQVKSQLSEESSSEGKKPVEPVAPIYIPLDPFTASLMPTEEGGDRVLYIGLTLRVSDVHSKELIEKFLPDIRSRLLVLFSQQSAAALSSHEGKQALIKKIKEEVNHPLYENQSATVNDVLLNAFILR